MIEYSLHVQEGATAILSKRVEEAHFEVDETGMWVELHASIESLPGPPPGLGTPQMATILVIRMDRGVATQLCSRFCDLAQTMGWPLPTTNESPT